MQQKNQCFTVRLYWLSQSVCKLQRHRLMSVLMAGIANCWQNVIGTCGFLDLALMKFGRTRNRQQQKHTDR